MESRLKSLLKAVKLNESTISMLLGLGVVIVVAGLVINYFKSKPAELPTLENQEITTNDEAAQEEFAETPAEQLPPFSGELPVSYKIRAGDNLWKIAERYYQTGYGWVEIAQANKLANPNLILKDQDLTVPQLAKAYPMTVEVREPAIGGASSTSLTEEQEANSGAIVLGNQTNEQVPNPISGDSYVTVRGDSLWKIAIRAYNDGYQWV